MYKALNKQVHKSGNYTITPLRYEDRLDIMKWRNEQIYHLRQNQPLTEIDQNNYFKDVVKAQFSQKRPYNILFSLETLCCDLLISVRVFDVNYLPSLGRIFPC